MADKKDPMLSEEETEPDDGIYTLTDEEGNDIDFELVGSAEIDGVHYFAMIPVEPDKNEDEAYEYVILKSELDENGEEMLVTIDDDEEFDKAADYFDDYFNTEVDYDN